MKEDWNDQVRNAKNCSDPENVVSTAWHLALLFNKFSEKSVFYRIATKNAIDYMRSNGCEDVYGIAETALNAYKSWGKIPGLSNSMKSKYPLKCILPRIANQCPEKAEGSVEVPDIIGSQYQIITSAQNVITHTWDKSLLGLYGITR